MCLRRLQAEKTTLSRKLAEETKRTTRFAELNALLERKCQKLEEELLALQPGTPNRKPWPSTSISTSASSAKAQHEQHRTTRQEAQHSEFAIMQLQLQIDRMARDAGALAALTDELRAENMRLKQELAFLDPDFFDEIEGR